MLIAPLTRMLISRANRPLRCRWRRQLRQESLEQRLALDSTVVFNELYYHPSRDQPTNLEWIELHNQMSVNMDISGWTLSDGVNFKFPEGTIVPGHSHLVVASDPAALALATGYDQALGPLDGRISNGGERLVLANQEGRRMNVLEYDDNQPWPVGADGSGFSLAKILENTTSDRAENWTVSTQRNGTPGARNFSISDPIVEPLVKAGDQAEYLVPADGSLGTDWTSGSFDGAAWMTAPIGLGFDTSDDRFESMVPPNRGLRFWLDASDLDADGISNNLTLGSEVHLWRDKILGLEFEPVEVAPQLAPLGPHGAHSVRFFGGDVLQELDDLHAEFLSDSRGSITIVYTNQNGQGENVPSGHSFLAGRLGKFVGTIVLDNDTVQAGFGIRTQRNGPVAGVPPSVNDGATHWSTITADGSQWQFFTDSAGPLPTAIGSGKNTGHWFGVNSSYEELTLGGFVLRDGTSQGMGWVGDIAEVLIYDHVLTNTERTAVDEYVKAKYFDLSVSPLVVSDIRSQMHDVSSSLYVRSEFDVTVPGEIESLLLKMTYDDGFVAYLNGHEVARRNSPASPTWDSTAVATPAAQFAQETIDVSVFSSFLVRGKNILAIHGLNRSPENRDFIVLPEFTAIRRTTNASTASPPVVVNEVAPAGSEHFWFELTNQSDQQIDLADLVVEINGRDWPVGEATIDPGRHTVVTLDGTNVRNGDQLMLYSFDKSRLLDATRITNRLRGRSDRYGSEWLYPSFSTPAAANRFDFNDDIVINEIMYHAAPNLATSDTRPTYSKEKLLSFDSAWRYNATGADLGADWAVETYSVDNHNWLLGLGGIGFDRSPPLIPIRTELSRPTLNDPRFETYYFQTDFNLSPELLTADHVFHLRHMVDDAAAFYINGFEVARFNLPEGEITATTRAAEWVGQAELSLPIEVDVEILRPGKNVLSAELHLRSSASSSFFFAAELNLARPLTPLIPGRPFSENDEEWIELYNRGTRTVDLTDWTLRDAIDFDFSEGTEIAPGEYVVIAKDATSLAEAHPEIRIVGSFSRSLNNSNERILLRDERENPVDVVHYYDGGRWPNLADGRSSSLELRDPDADNSRAEAWGASDESDRSSWKTYTIRRIARADTGPVRWHEFVFGMLRDGKVLIDDVSVFHHAAVDPNAEPAQLIQNGDFENDLIGQQPDAWRIVGNHHGKVVTDPLDAENQVLLLDATGPTHHEHNYASTTFGDDQRIVNGDEYVISYRAKWLSGGNQLLSRFYVNRVAATSIIETPPHNGTPGRANSRMVANAGPTYATLSHRPVVPLPYQDVTVSVFADDSEGVSSLTLWWSVDGGSFSAVPMAGKDKVYRGIVPGQMEGAVIQFYVEGRDVNGKISTFPAAGANSRALFQVEDGQGVDNPLDNIRIVMLSGDTLRVFTPTEVMSNQFEGATVIVNRRDVFYDVDVRPKGSSRGRMSPRRWGSYTVRFHPDQLFRGVHERIGIDKSGGLSEKPHEIIVDQIKSHAAGGLVNSYTDLAYSIAPVSAHVGHVILELARYDRVFLDESFVDGGNATVFEPSLIYYPLATEDDTVEGLKLVEPNGVIGVPPGDYGEDKEFYRWNHLIKNNRARDDYDAVIAMNQAFSLSSDEFLEGVDKVVDIDQWLRTFALGVLIAARDSYLLIDWQHNMGLIVPPEDGRILLLPWDADTVFRQPGVSSENLQLADLLKYPKFEHMYYGHLHDILNTTFNSTYLSPWIEHFGNLVEQDWTTILDFADTQAGLVADLLRSKAPTVDFAATAYEKNHQGQASLVTIAGDAWINVREIHLAGSQQPLEVTWTDVTRWQVDVPVLTEVTKLTFEAYDFQGELVGVDTVAVSSSELPGDVTGDGLVDVDDIDLLNGKIQAMSNDTAFDLDEDGVVNRSDFRVLLESMGTDYGDANLDGVFDFHDLDLIFAAGEYADNDDLSTWIEGDFDGDGKFTSDDLVFAFQYGRFRV